MLVVVALVVVLILGVRYVRVFEVDERMVARVEELTVVRGSSDKKICILNIHVLHILLPKYYN